jgi:hypothetical protein
MGLLKRRFDFKIEFDIFGIRQGMNCLQGWIRRVWASGFDFEIEFTKIFWKFWKFSIIGCGYFLCTALKLHPLQARAD